MPKYRRIRGTMQHEFDMAEFNAIRKSSSVCVFNCKPMHIRTSRKSENVQQKRVSKKSKQTFIGSSIMWKQNDKKQKSNGIQFADIACGPYYGAVAVKLARVICVNSSVGFLSVCFVTLSLKRVSNGRIRSPHIFTICIEFFFVVCLVFFSAHHTIKHSHYFISNV